VANAEAVFISALFSNPDQQIIGEYNITPDLFDVYKEPFTWIWKYMARQGRLPAKISFKQKHPEVPIYKDITDVDLAVDDLKREYARRTATYLLDEAVESLVNGKISEAINDLGTGLIRVQAVMEEKHDDYDVSQQWRRSYDEVSEKIMRVRQTGAVGVATGFDTLDNTTGGLQPGWYCVVAARRGQGKTWTMVRMACEAAWAGFTALYYSLEQPETQITLRTHSILSKFAAGPVFNNIDLQRGSGFVLQEYRKFLEGMESGMKGRLVIVGAGRERVTPMTVAGGIERVQPDVVFIDYITLMGMRGDGGWQSVGNLSADIQQLSQRYKVPIVVGAQHNQNNTVARADSITMDADLIIELQRKSIHVIKHKIEKFRHGMDGVSYWTEYEPGLGVYEEITADEAVSIMDSDSSLE
jgi:replicative DNA helicase